MSKGIDLSPIYQSRQNFAIVAMTGRTGSGRTTIAQEMAKGFQETSYTDPSYFKVNHNSYRKYRIIHKYARVNFKPFTVIRYRDVQTLFLIKDGLDCLKNFLVSETLRLDFERARLSDLNDFSNEIADLSVIEGEFSFFSNECVSIFLNKENDEAQYRESLYRLFFSPRFKTFSDCLHRVLGSRSQLKRGKFLQAITYNLRSSGRPYSTAKPNPTHLFTLVDLINDLIKSKRKIDGYPTKVVIDSLRNPLEILFFKQRFSAFYVISVNREDENRRTRLKEKYGGDYDRVMNFLEEEYKGGKGGEFHKQYVRECIEKADIHLTYRSFRDAETMNESREQEGDNTSPYFSWQMQLLKYISLIDHPGLVTPSPEERCMQLAYTAKYNSGCISRQVGSAITDKYYSVKAIGWNNTPEGQVPCVLRDAEVLMNSADREPMENNSKAISDVDPGLAAFTPYEKYNREFRSALENNFKQQIGENQSAIGGRNICFCFKSLKNSYSEGKNQVHTRSLHAEESAFLQITKYGGTGVKDGKLFTTASPCELCSKKAYQLGIKVIYYIDPYPGISQKQILEAGSRSPSVRLFNGAIGTTYHWLYEPLMAYKDEMSLILGQEVKDLASRQEAKIRELTKEVEALRKLLSQPSTSKKDQTDIL